MCRLFDVNLSYVRLVMGIDKIKHIDDNNVVKIISKEKRKHMRIRKNLFQDILKIKCEDVADSSDNIYSWITIAGYNIWEVCGFVVWCECKTRTNLHTGVEEPECNCYDKDIEYKYECEIAEFEAMVRHDDKYYYIRIQ